MCLREREKPEGRQGDDKKLQTFTPVNFIDGINNKIKRTPALLMAGGECAYASLGATLSD